MKKLLYKLTSSCLALVMLLSTTQAFAVAISFENDSNSTYFEYQETKYYSESDGENIYTTAIYPEGNLEIIIRNINNNFYKFAEIPATELSTQNLCSLQTCINDITSYSNNHQDIFSIIDIQNAGSVTRLVPDDLLYFQGILEDAYGSEYSGTVIDRIAQAPERKVTEDMSFILDYQGRFNAARGMSYASFITGVLGLIANSSILGIFSTIFGGADILAGDHVDYYLLSVEYNQVGWCGGNAYNSESRTITYKGFVGPYARDIDTVDYYDAQTNYFDITDHIMQDAYIYWLNS